ncbi:NlpC/P60 family protein [Ruania zhangjianzhongii]|uniref:C40 family peptidase n=1 Tax=Ruania zhangjianzhongii TaxID=2603206 RepID=UPI0011CC5280|nr:C40 family peptidase [Ruania zhangjianzhongii]
MTRTKWRSAVAALAAGVLAGTLSAAPAQADPDYPSEDDIAQAEQAEQSTADRVRTIEVQLAANNAELEQTRVDAQVAAEAYNQASVALEQAQADADAAATDAEQADADVLAAQQQVAQIAMASYRNNGEVQQLSMFFSADDFEQALDRATMFEVLGSDADDAHQRLDAAERVAEVMHLRADETLADAEAAAQLREEASRDADAAALVAQNAVESTASERNSLITELASLRETTVELEDERQAGIEAEQRERENAAAAAALEAQAEQEAAEEAARAEAAEEQETARDRSTEDSQSSSSSSDDRSERPRNTDSGSSGSSGGNSSGSSSSGDSGSSGGSGSDSGSSSSGSSGGSSSDSGSGNSGSDSGGSTAPSSVGRTALNWAMTQIGKPYVWGADGPNSYDCSGLTMRAFQNAGVNLPRTTGAQYAATTHVPVGDMRPGDLIFYSSNGSASGIYHVAIYAGNGMRVHAPSPGSNVEHVQIWWTNVLPYAGRV